MISEVRSANIRILRHIHSGLGNLAREISQITNEAALIKMGQGEKEMPDIMARSIEKKLGLPTNWMDRDNDEIIKMSELDYQIYKKILIMSDKKKSSLDAFIS